MSAAIPATIVNHNAGELLHSRVDSMKALGILA